MEYDFTALRFWFDVVQLTGTLAIAVYVWWDKRKKANEKRFCALEEIVGGHSASLQNLVTIKEEKDTDCKERLKRLETLERDVHHLPSREEISKLSDQIGSLREDLGQLNGRLTGINRAVDLLNQHHLRTDL